MQKKVEKKIKMGYNETTEEITQETYYFGGDVVSYFMIKVII